MVKHDAGDDPSKVDDAGNAPNEAPGEPEVDPAYLNPPQVIAAPGSEYAPSTRRFQGIPSLACDKAGRLWAVWYGGVTPGEDHNNYVMLATSDDRGNTWSNEKLVIDPDGPGPVRAFDPEIWLAPDGRLWLFWAQGLGEQKIHTRSGVWAMTAEEAAGVEGRWSTPRRLTDGVMMCKPVVLSTGEWCLPISLWHKRERGSASMWVSDDAGATWTQRGACDVPPEVRSHDEHMIVERHDGSLWMLVRTKYGIGQSVSRDGGRTWDALTPTGLPHPSSRFFVRRLASGRLLCVRHAPAERDAADGQSKGVRSHLTAFLSEDDGRSWPYNLLLDERVGVSYPDGDQADDGTIYITYDHQRKDDREILLAVFREEDVLKAAARSAEARFRVTINKAGD